jgi:putative membrane protein
MGVIISVLANALLLFALAYFLPYDPSTGTGVISSNTWSLYLIGGAILGVLNFFVKPILTIIGFPFVILSFGLFVFVISGFILYMLE